MKRTLDGRFLTDVANHTDVRPWLLGDGPIDLVPLVADPSNIVLQSEFGGWILTRQGIGVYEVHSLFLPEGRGEQVRAMMTDALRYVFVHTDAVRLVTRCPCGNVAALALARSAGFRSWFSTSAGRFMQMDLADWVQSDENCLKAGREFHDRLEAIKAAHDSLSVVHDDDDAHDRAAGFALLSARAGNAPKGVVTYNQWASLAGYAPIQIVSLNPLVIDVVDAVLEGPDMEVLLCR